MLTAQIRTDIERIISDAGKLRPLGLKTIAMTTNGVCVLVIRNANIAHMHRVRAGIVLARKLPELAASGLNIVNISLDTLGRRLCMLRHCFSSFGLPGLRRSAQVPADHATKRPRQSPRMCAALCCCCLILCDCAAIEKALSLSLQVRLPAEFHSINQHPCLRMRRR
mgnify:CR=1 FL=1